ncbi:MAG: sigma-70 family RNA polymerase sigma factor [Planctomycetes bacterium]|nr:sigma-70 family RNA polymerase sigma factor [Planctomycetota bacterium]
MPPAADPTERFERILAETQGQVRAYIAGMGVPVAEVDDVAQEVYLDFWRQPERMPAGVAPLQWLRGVARNCCYEHFRRRAPRSAHLVRIAELLDVAAEPPSAVDQDQRLAALRHCLSRLDSAQRDLLDAYYRDGRGIAELAADSRRSADAVHMVLVRLRGALRRCIGDRPGTPS